MRPVQPIGQLINLRKNNRPAPPREAPQPSNDLQESGDASLKKRIAHQFEEITGRPYEKSADGSDLLTLVARYLSSPSAASRGLLICGGVGLGKTKIMQAASHVTEAFRLIGTRDLVRRFNGLKTPYDKDYFFKTHSAPPAAPIAYDDLGAELDASNYGRFNLLAEIIQLRYDRNLVTHFTTNLDMDALIERYGLRVADRLREMCYLIHVAGPSKRRA